MQAWARGIFLAALCLAFLAMAPNALWLARSSALVRNDAAEPVELRLVLDDGTVLINDLGTIRPGGRRFAWLAARGEATFAVEVRRDGAWQRHCGEYVEGAMYRVEVTIRAPDEVTCSTGLPVTERLLLGDIVF